LANNIQPIFDSNESIRYCIRPTDDQKRYFNRRGGKQRPRYAKRGRETLFREEPDVM